MREMLDDEQHHRLLTHHPHASAWIQALPEIVATFLARWEVSIEHVYRPGGNASWCAAVRRSDGQPAVLKIDVPLRYPKLHGYDFYDGGGMVRLLESDESAGVHLLERCEPGTPASGLPAAAADDVAAELLPRLWREARTVTGIPRLSEHAAYEIERLRDQSQRLNEPVLAEAADVEAVLLSTIGDEWLLHGDFHGPNVLHSGRGWLAIDPEPMLGDRCYDLAFWLLYQTDTDLEARGSELAVRLGLPPVRALAWLAVKTLNYCANILAYGWQGDLQANLEVGRRLLRDYGSQVR